MEKELIQRIEKTLKIVDNFLYKHHDSEIWIWRNEQKAKMDKFIPKFENGFALDERGAMAQDVKKLGQFIHEANLVFINISILGLAFEKFVETTVAEDASNPALAEALGFIQAAASALVKPLHDGCPSDDDAFADDENFFSEHHLQFREPVYLTMDPKLASDKNRIMFYQPNAPLGMTPYCDLNDNVLVLEANLTTIRIQKARLESIKINLEKNPISKAKNKTSMMY